MPAHGRSALAALPLILCGCATMFSGTTDTLRFDSNVPGVRLTIDGQFKGELPLTLEMSRSFVDGRQFIATFEKPGYQAQEFKLSREFNPVAILDVSSTVVSGGVDVLTGALMRFSPKEYHVQMLEAGKDARSSAFRRSAALHEYALANCRGLQAELARGGGERLDTFAAMVGGAQEAPQVAAATVRDAPALVAATTPHAFVRELNRVLGEDPALRGYAF